MIETLRDLLLDPLLWLRIFFCNLGIYTRYPTLFIIDCLLYLFRVGYFTFTLFSKESKECTYGESVYASLNVLFNTYKTDRHTRFCDLGSGLGKAVFYTDKVLGMQSVGVEIKPIFVTVSNVISVCFFFKNTSFILGNFKDTLPEADIYLVPSTCLESDTLSILADKIKPLPGTLIFSISAPVPLNNAETLGQHFLYFSWGKATVYVQRVCDTL